jgi:hypothetical protein
LEGKVEERVRDSIVDTYPPACGMRMHWARRNINSETLYDTQELGCENKHDPALSKVYMPFK